MSEEVKNITSDMLARLRGMEKGGVDVEQSQSKTVDSAANQEQQKPKRDIQELYDFIDAYCSGKDEN